MKANKLYLLMVLCVVLLQTGCYTNLYLNFGNGTGQRVSVKDMQTGKEARIGPGRFRKISHDQADIVVIMPDKTRYVYSGVKVADPAIDTRYFPQSSNGVFGLGSWSFELSTLLETNMDLYVLLPGKTAVDESVPQPVGYPKVGARTPN